MAFQCQEQNLHYFVVHGVQMCGTKSPHAGSTCQERIFVDSASNELNFLKIHSYLILVNVLRIYVDFPKNFVNQGSYWMMILGSLDLHSSHNLCIYWNPGYTSAHIFINFFFIFFSLELNVLCLSRNICATYYLSEGSWYSSQFLRIPCYINEIFVLQWGFKAFNFSRSMTY